MSPLPPADSGLRGLSPTVTFRSGISGDELANGCGDCDGRIVGRDRRECDFRSNPVAAGRAHALCCESRFSQFVKSASQATPDCNRDFHRKGRKRSLQRLHTSLNFQYRPINPCTLSTENGGCTRFRNAEARVASSCRMVARAALSGAPRRHFQSVTLLPFAVCALEGHGHGVSFGLDPRDCFVKLGELWIGGRIAHCAPIPRLVTVPGPNPDTGSRDLD